MGYLPWSSIEAVQFTRRRRVISRSRERESDFANLLSQGLAGDPQQERGLVLAPPGEFHDAGQEESVELAVCCFIEFADFSRKAFADDERLDAGLIACGRRAAGPVTRSREVRKKCREQDCPGALE